MYAPGASGDFENRFNTVLKNGKQDSEVRTDVSVVHQRSPKENAIRAQYRKMKNAKQAIIVLDTDQHLVNYVETDGEYIVSAGQDHEINIWDASTGTHLRCLSGHQAPITGVALLSSYRGQELARKSGYKLSERIVVSASQDRTIRLWSLHRGDQLRRFESDEVITCFGLMNQILAITGNHKGQLEVRHLGAGDMPALTEAHLEKIDAIAIEGLHVCSATFGEPARMKVWKLNRGQLICMYSSEEALEFLTEPKEMCAVALNRDVVIMGNALFPILHLTNWKTNQRARVHTLSRSGVPERRDGCVQQIRVTEDLLLSSSMCEDEMKVQIDVFLLPDYEHICAFSCETEKVLAIAYAKSENNIKLVFGGTSLLVLDLLLPTDDYREQLPALRYSCRGLGSHGLFMTKCTERLKCTESAEENNMRTGQIIQDRKEVFNRGVDTDYVKPQADGIDLASQEVHHESESSISFVLQHFDQQLETGSTGFLVSPEPDEKDISCKIALSNSLEINNECKEISSDNPATWKDLEKNLTDAQKASMMHNGITDSEGSGDGNRSQWHIFRSPEPELLTNHTEKGECTEYIRLHEEQSCKEFEPIASRANYDVRNEDTDFKLKEKNYALCDSMTDESSRDSSLGNEDLINVAQSPNESLIVKMANLDINDQSTISFKSANETFDTSSRDVKNLTFSVEDSISKIRKLIPNKFRDSPKNDNNIEKYVNELPKETMKDDKSRLSNVAAYARKDNKEPQNLHNNKQSRSKFRGCEIF